jgi:hypothetical protein
MITLMQVQDKLMPSSPLSLNLCGPFASTSELEFTRYKAVSPPCRPIQKGTSIQCAEVWGLLGVPDREDRRVIDCKKKEGGLATVECGRRDRKTGELSERFFIVFDAKDVHIDDPTHCSFLTKLLHTMRSVICLKP